MSVGVSESLIAVLRSAHAALQGQRVSSYLVGGLVRDQVLGRATAALNIDLAVPQRALEVSRELAATLHGAFVPLDDAEGTARVVLRQDDQVIELDISDFRGPTLDADLRLRDFTVNAMAIELGDWLRDPHRPTPLIDPLDGQAALRARRLTPCFPGTFDADPVRILRGFRFAAQLGFALDEGALALMRRAAPRLSAVSGERIRDELLAICATDRAHGAVVALTELGVVERLIPELKDGRDMDQGSFHHLDVLGHQVETVAQADRFLADFSEFSEPLRQPLAEYCAQELVEKRSRKALIKLSGLLHDVGKPSSRQIHPDGEIWFIGHEHTGAKLVEGIVERLKLSNREGEMVRLMVRHHLWPGFLSREPQLTRRAVYRFFKELGDHGPSCLLVWWADRMATRGTKSRLDQIDEQRARLEELFNAYFFKAEEVVKPIRLLDGRSLMRELSLEPGPMIGTLLSAIEEAQAEGRIRSAEDALALARDVLSAHGDRPGGAGGAAP